MLTDARISAISDEWKKLYRRAEIEIRNETERAVSGGSGDNFSEYMMEISRV